MSQNQVVYGWWYGWWYWWYTTTHLIQKVKVRNLGGLGLGGLGKDTAQRLGNIIDCILSNLDLFHSLVALASIVSMSLAIIKANELVQC